MSNFGIKQRILMALKDFGIEPKDLGDGNQSKSRKMRRQIEGETELTESTISEILNRYKNLSAEWLLRGSGSMLLSEPQHETLTGEIRNDSETIAALKETIAAQKIAIDALTDQVKVLKGDIVVPHRSAATA